METTSHITQVDSRDTMIVKKSLFRNSCATENPLFSRTCCLIDLTVMKMEANMRYLEVAH